ncbi:amidohydrolase family protein [Chelatococcus asaccharovorans]|uniref:Aminocarboxymuconate-semialdehyde decarboxylase n=1 Tax=Chelatococcus asaccharovorans TaxID=28210 RepID=A0A2V3UH85_9HYPH|nr:amidohydrolase family protein [Chelatococcus asaccharovorans]MBS7706628.1 amidohydrolase [Chelatococcus asaccharovorans]PXW64722.1 aminocarboxymuconate-semialdehyde decarboxylase [Chelatococcus asaccharovorans]CAH1663584.1 Aminocarboxymuconate-semialdehyde decarboxylase [Chelatococcus asaccharovorans]CAH1682735.1 Aminocarboxymuconate-semialdehyde decarboxylase [Chelatococcus asaccharovorans]
MIVDAHNHVIPASILRHLEDNPEPFGVRVDRSGAGTRLAHREGFAYPLFDEFVAPEEKLRQLDRRGIDAAIISPSPTLFFYRIAPEAEAAFARRVNDAVAAFAAAAPERLRPMGTLPMQSPEDALAELDRITTDLGMRAVTIGCHIDGQALSEPKFRPVLRRAAALGVLILTHPYYFGAKPGLEKYYLTNLIGNPLDTAVMAADLIFGGVMDEVPDLRICLSHGGGFLPYQIGRLVHGRTVRREAQTIPSSPKDLLKRFYFDTITHDAAALGYLIDLVGARQVLLGTDIPFDMADETPMRTLEAVPGLSADARALIAGRNAWRLTGA